MHRRTTLPYALVAALAAIAVAASPALARPADRIDRYDHAKPAPHRADPPFSLGQPTWPVDPAPAAKPAKPAPVKPAGGDDGDIWLALGVGIATTGIVAGSAAGAVRRNRLRARRASA